ncbi:hypothetical protein K227x_64340 [Rubripirellula lacrimiformis]|uniref:Uncharacterized protein n=1 Tax=Rubripirellula lacrimiformis TaxID=1930273 RepID=A0A517NLI5_9BACT|nr:hypothetical protein [Rubripirellula lacrimiformis]QDT08004.1 hypothetical protein K227x_64340 [Rubripirellula lacrimiformis]
MKPQLPKIPGIELEVRSLTELMFERSDAIAQGRWFRRGEMIAVDSVDESARTVSATIASETPVMIYDSSSHRYMQEVLVMAGGIFPPWTPMLRSHERWDIVGSTLGSVLDTKRVGKTARGQLSFVREDPDVDKVWVRVRDGHLRAVSVGGRRLTFTDIEPGASAVIDGRKWRAGRSYPLRVTTSWVQREASIVIFGADPTAGTNS